MRHGTEHDSILKKWWGPERVMPLMSLLFYVIVLLTYLVIRSDFFALVTSTTMKWGLYILVGLYIFSILYSTLHKFHLIESPTWSCTKLLSETNTVYTCIFSTQFLIGTYLLCYYPSLFSDNKTIGYMAGWTQCTVAVVSTLVMVFGKGSESEWCKTMLIYPILWMDMSAVASTITLFSGPFFDSPVIINNSIIPESNRTWEDISSELLIGIFLIEQIIDVIKLAVYKLDYLKRLLKYDD